MAFLDGVVPSTSQPPGKDAPTCSVFHRSPLNSDFRNSREEGAVSVTFTNEFYYLISYFLDRVPIIPDVFRRLGKDELSDGSHH